MRYIFIKLVGFYRYLISPLLGRNCRFYPTCSSYMQQAIQTHGVLKGLFLGTKRLLKCHPWHKGNMIDEVPPASLKSIAWADLIGYNRLVRSKRRNNS